MSLYGGRRNVSPCGLTPAKKNRQIVVMEEDRSTH